MKTLKLTSIVLVVVALVMSLSFYALDKETHTLDDDTRASLNATFSRLSLGNVHYKLEGSGTRGSIVLVHGFSTPSYIWDKNVDALIAEGFRVLRFDLYGRGYSDRPDIQYDIDVFVDQLSELSHGLLPGETFHLVGISMGGPITTRFSHQQPERVKSLSLLAPLVETPERLDLNLIATPLLGEFLSGVVMMPKLVNGLANTVYDVASYPEWHEQLAKHIHFKGYRQALLSTARYLTGRSFVEDYQSLASTSIPAQLIWGRQDKIVHYNQHLLIREVMPDIPLHSLDQTGHLPQIEQPGQVNKLLLNFLTQQQGQTS